MIRRITLFFASLFIGIGLLVWVVDFIGWQEIRLAISLFAGWHGLIILVLTALMLFLGMWKWQIILKSQGYNLSHWQLINPYLSGFALVYLFPIFVFGGDIFKGYLLREKLSVPWKNGITSIFIDKILETTFFLLTIFAGLVFFILKIGLPPMNLGMILGGFLFVVTASVVFFYFKIFKKESIIKILAKFFSHKKLLNVEILEAEKEIFIFFKYRRRALLGASFLAFLRVVVTWLRCWVLILFLGKSISFSLVLPILGFYYFVFMIPIPAALGSHEIIQTFSFNALGLGAGIAPVFTMIQRGAELILAFAGLAIFIRLGLGLIRTFLFKRIESLLK